MAAVAVYVHDLNWLGSKWLLRQQQFQVCEFEKLRALASVFDVMKYAVDTPLRQPLIRNSSAKGGLVPVC
ncbi:hypothetical protein RvY_01385 [Ramazzottius varieornatus]|uniref:Uncharacterized protein n=1 Tax=Ramazzottius varieornatus TaxID=947166 RepID=A0A1D1UN95_RAMVA|nr:hypothetical protein RvY_01385 [Ramazzottius varieornatus]